jgi:thioredoxin 1
VYSIMVVCDKTVSNRTDFLRVISENSGTVIFKFSAEWCGPCKKIAPDVAEFKKKIADRQDITWYDIDVDDSIQVFGMLKTKRIVNGVPAVLVYMSENESIYPDEFVLGANKKDLNVIFDAILAS